MSVSYNVRIGFTISLQKQVGSFNHRVVTLVADKLERQWLRDVYTHIVLHIKNGPE